LKLFFGKDAGLVDSLLKIRRTYESDIHNLSRRMFTAVFVSLIIFSSVFVGVAYGSIYIDKEVYTWTDKVHIKLITYGYNSDRDVIRIFTSDHELDSYKLSKGENGFYTGEIILTGFLHDANGDGKPDTNPRTMGSGSNDGFLETKRDGGLTISLEFADGTVMSKSAKITWNIGKIAFDMPTYATDDLARLQVIDPDMNLNPETLDKIGVHAFSDSDSAGILVNAVETQEESGLFEVIISFSQDKPSSGNRLFANLEDKIYAKYEDHTLPAPYNIRDDLDIIAESTVKTDFKRLQSNVDDVLSNEHEFPTVYQIPDIVFDKLVYTWGDQVNIQLVAPLDNQDSKIIENLESTSATFPFRIHTTPEYGALENYTLVETGPDTGIFQGSFMIIKPGDYKTSGLGPDDGFLKVDSSIRRIDLSFDVGPDTLMSRGAEFTHPKDPDPPSEYVINKTHPIYPNIKFDWMESTSPYDGIGAISVQFPSQNISETIVDILNAHFSSYGDDGIYVILRETGPDTGIFEGILPIATYDSFTKLTLSKSDNALRSSHVQYQIDDGLTFGSESNSLLLHNGLEYSTPNQNIPQNTNLILQTDKNSYLPSQPILVSGTADPDDTLHLMILFENGSTEKFQQKHTSNDGFFFKLNLCGRLLIFLLEYTLYKL